jgi:hypothetical protein
MMEKRGEKEEKGRSETKTLADSLYV